jgi:hypothetical protein
MDASHRRNNLIHHQKPLPMLSKQHINRLIIFSFMVLVGFSLAKAIYHQSVMGIILALVSLGAGVYFLYILAKAKEERESEGAV